MSEVNDLHNLIATAMTGVVKQIKAIRYYPPEHPALQAAAEECLRGFQPILTGGQHLSLEVRKEGFLFNDQLVAKSNQLMGQLAMFCFARRIQYLTILPGLTAKDLNHFVHYLNINHVKIQKLGGIQALLERAQVTTIWTNLWDLDDILDRKEKLEQKPLKPDVDPVAVLAEAEANAQNRPVNESLDLHKLLKRLEQEKDDTRFHNGVQELIPLLRQNLDPESRPLILHAMLLLCRTASSKKFSETRREQAQHALGQLASPDLVGYLVDYLLDDTTPEKARDNLSKVLIFLGERADNIVMEKLAWVKSVTQRKILVDILVQCGEKSVPMLLEHLFDERWYVVRNAVTILGEIRSQESMSHLTPLLEHKDLRVCRETIRTLTKVGGHKAIDILLQAAECGDQEIRRQALLSLGAIRASTAVPTLVKILRRPGWSQNTIELKKDAVRSLGEIRSPDAIPDLLKVAGKKSVFKRKINDELRIAAIHALGETEDEVVRDFLEKTTNDKSAPVARAAAQALKQIEKANL